MSELLTWSTLSPANLDRTLIAQAVALLIIVPGLLLAGRSGQRLANTVWDTFGRLSRHRVGCVVAAGLLSFLMAAFLTWLNRPEPVGHDEFSYLLAADTFARGRLTNPTHPMWVHFESIHIIQHPTYASKYPPGQGLLLALGQVVGGDPAVGVWISMGLLAASTLWMLQAWLPPRWALLGGLLCATHLGHSYWARSYYGGALAATGGALLFGAARRLVREPSAAQSLVLAAGVAVLANSRPYEGLLASLPVAALLSAWILGRRGPALGVTFSRVVLPAVLTLGLTAALMGLYNRSVTGSALLLPYKVHEATYSPAPTFLFQAPKAPPAYRHAAMREFHINEELASYYEQRSPTGLALGAAGKLFRFWQFYIGPLFTVPLLLGVSLVRQPWMRFGDATLAVVLAGVLLTTWFNPHYTAPVLCLLWVFIVQGLRVLRTWRVRAFPAGRLLARAICAACALVLASYFVWHPFRLYPTPWGLARAQLSAELRQRPGEHLVIVRYGAGHNTRAEWVYNEADIDAAKIVWARDLGVLENRPLLEHFKGRHAWYLDGDAVGSNLTPYPVNGTPLRGDR